MVALEEKSRITQVIRIPPLGTMSVEYFVGIRLIIVWLFQSGPKWCTDRLTDIAWQLCCKCGCYRIGLPEDGFHASNGHLK